MAQSLAPYIHVILADVLSITLYINKPLVRLTTAHYQSAVSMISFAQGLDCTMIQYNSLSECSVSSQNNISRYSVSTLPLNRTPMTIRF